MKSMIVKILTHVRAKQFFVPLLIVAFVVFVNSPYLIGFANPNPINLQSGLRDSLSPARGRGLNTIDPSVGYYTQALGHRAAIDLLHGRMPWWNHYEGIGSPLIGEMESAALFPLVFLLGLSNGVLYFHLALEIIAGVSMYYLLRRLRLGSLPAFVAGCAFAVNGTFAWFGHSAVTPIAFLPMLILGIELALEKSREQRAGGWVTIALALALSLYAGFPETAFIDGLLAGLWAIVRLSSLQKVAYKGYAIKIIAGLLTGIGLAAPLLVAFVDYLPFANLGLHSASTAGLVLPKIGLPALLMPYVYGPIFANYGFDSTSTLLAWWGSVGGYMGMALLTLAVFGFLHVKRDEMRAVKILLICWIVFCVFASYGILKFNLIAGHIPLLSVSAFHRYFPPSYSFALAVLAAYGLEGVERQGNVVPRKHTVIVAGALLVLLTVNFLYARVELHRLLGSPHLRLWAYGSLLFALTVLMLITAGLLLVSRIPRRFLMGMIAGVTILEAAILFMVPMLSAPRAATINEKPVAFLRQHLGNQRVYSLGPLMPNYGSYFGVAQININDLPEPKSYSKYIVSNLNHNTDPILFTGTNMVNASGDTPAEAFIKNIKSYEELSVGYVAATPGLLTDSQVKQARLLEVYKDRTAEIYQLPNPKPYLDSEGNCHTTSKGRDEFVVDCTKRTTIIRREQSMPGWNVSLDRKEVIVSTSGKIFQTVNVPAGRHILKYSFRPEHMAIAWVTFVLSALALPYGIFAEKITAHLYPKRGS